MACKRHLRARSEVKYRMTSRLASDKPETNSAVIKTLFDCSILGIMLPSCMGIAVSYYVDPYLTHQYNGCHNFFEHRTMVDS